jgi:hypothetical protein
MLGLSKLILGCCYCTEKEYSRGIETFRLCLEQRKNVANNAADIHISAFTQYELATLLIKTNEVSRECVFCVVFIRFVADQSRGKGAFTKYFQLQGLRFRAPTQRQGPLTAEALVDQI